MRRRPETTACTVALSRHLCIDHPAVRCVYKYNFASKELTKLHAGVLPQLKYVSPVNSFRCSIYSDRSRNELMYYIMIYRGEPNMRVHHGQFTDIVAANMAANIIMHPKMNAQALCVPGCARALFAAFMGRCVPS